MLLLSRKCGQSIVIGDDIVVTVIAVDRNRVQIGIKAPNHVPIFRQEIVKRMIATGEIEAPQCLEPPQSAAVCATAGLSSSAAPVENTAGQASSGTQNQVQKPF